MKKLFLVDFLDYKEDEGASYLDTPIGEVKVYDIYYENMNCCRARVCRTSDDTCIGTLEDSVDMYEPQELEIEVEKLVNEYINHVNE